MKGIEMLEKNSMRTKEKRRIRSTVFDFYCPGHQSGFNSQRGISRCSGCRIRRTFPQNNDFS